MNGVWAQRAAAAEHAVLHRHLRRLWGLPGIRLGVVANPASLVERGFLRWHYWWQAHLIDCLIDACLRSPTTARRERIVELIAGVHVRNCGTWTNSYYDDMAWLGLALHRGDALLELHNHAAVRTLSGELTAAWSPDGIPWRRGDVFRNVPANGPAAILLARTGTLDDARVTADWINAKLVDPETGLVCDGLRPGGLVEQTKYTYCQGVVLGAETELAVRTGEPVHRQRVHQLVDAVARHLGVDGVLPGAGGGDGGLFAGILARYLAMVALQLPGAGPAEAHARSTAAKLVLDSAEAAWTHRLEVDGRPLFGASWKSPAELAERDLSVQLSGWMLLEAAAALELRGEASR